MRVQGLLQSARRGALAVWMAAATLLGLAFAGEAFAGENVTSVSGAEAGKLVSAGAVLVDVRRADEWRETGIAPGSVLITAYDAQGNLEPDFMKRVMAAAGPNQPIVLICRSGNRSTRAGALISSQEGQHAIYSVDGGVRAWIAAGNAVQPCSNC